MADTTLERGRAAGADPAATAGVDPRRVEEFAGRVLDLYASGMLTAMVDLGHRTGLFTAAAAGPATSEGLAERAGLEERYVREWLGAMVTGRIFDYEPDGRVYTLPPEHAEILSAAASGTLAPLAQIQTHLSKHLHEVAGAFREGGGVPYSAFRPEFTDVMDAASRATFDAGLLDWLEAAPGLRERLEAGARVADVGCGTGHAIVLLAQAFPSSTFTGYDIAEDAVAQGRAEAAAAGLDNARFTVCDAPALRVDEPFDVVLVFDAIHDQADPTGALRAIHGALAPGGLLFMSEIHAATALEDNVGNPLAPWLYGVSTLHCMTVSLAEGGAGLGTVWGEEQARRMLAEAGFTGVETHEVPGDPLNLLFLATRPAG